jgi:hypothetical protein
VAALLLLAGAAFAGSGKEWSTNVELFAGGRDDRVLAGAEALFPFHQNESSMTFADVAGWIGDEGTNQLGLGVGHRFMDGSGSNIFGFYGFLDSKETSSGERFNRASIGFEVLSMAWEARANYYLSLTDMELVDIGEGGGYFQGNELYANSVTEELLDGWDAEVGFRLPFDDKVETRLFLGGYGLDGEAVGDETGWRTRLELRPRMNIAVELAYQDDGMFDDRTTFMLRYSFGYKRKSGIRTVRERMIQPPVRNTDAFTTDELPAGARESMAASDRTLISSDVYHIHNDPEGDSASDWASLDGRYTGEGEAGSYENPYTSVGACYGSGDCQSGEYIYLHAGDGSTYMGAIALETGQHLIGQGASFHGFGGDAYPNLTATEGAVVSMGSNTEVAGLAISGISGAQWGILSSNNSGTVHIHDNLIGVLVDNATGMLSPYGLTSNGMHLEIYPDGGETLVQELIVVRNDVRYSGSQGIILWNGPLGGSATEQYVLLADNTVIDNGDMGIEIDNRAVEGGTALQIVEAIGNTILDNGWNGFDADNIAENGGVATQAILISDCTIEDNYHEGIEIWQGAWSGGTAEQELVLWDSSASGNGSIGVVVSNNANDGTAVQLFDLSGNDISDNYEQGVRLGNEAPPDWSPSEGGSTATQGGTMTDNIIMGNGNDGIYLHNSADQSSPGDADTAIQGVTLTDNIVEDNGDEGVEMDNHASHGNTAIQSVAVIRGSYSGNESDGFDLEQGPNDAGGVATQELAIISAVIDGNGSDGIEMTNSATTGAVATQSVVVIDSNIRDNTEYGVNMEENSEDATGSAVRSVDLDSATVSGNGSGVYSLLLGGTQTIILPDGTVLNYP